MGSLKSVSDRVGGWRMWRLYVAAAICAASMAPSANASELVDRNASGVRLAVNGRGEALITYTAHARLKHVLAWGAINARAPSQAQPQVAFRLDYAGGFGKYHRAYWRNFGHQCGAYRGQPLAWLVAACTAPDGSNWALQAWQRSLPNYGVFASVARSAWDIRLSHWTGPLAALTVKTDWTYRRFDHLYGSLVYQGKPVYGFHTTRLGSPLDGYGRLIYVDTFEVRLRLASRERLRDPPAERDLLLRVLSPRWPSGGEGNALPGNGDRARRDSRRPLAEPGARPLQPRRRRPCERRAASGIFRPVMSSELKSTPPCSPELNRGCPISGRAASFAGRPTGQVSRLGPAHRTAKPSA